MIRYIILLIIVFVSGCQTNKVKTVVIPARESELPTQESWHSKVFFTDSGKTKAILTAGHIRVFELQKQTLLDNNIKVDFFSPLEKQTTTLTAKKGKVNDATQDLYATDSVVVVNDSGVTITTDELMWRNQDRKIVSDKHVVIVTPTEHIEGEGFESDQDLRNYVIYKINFITNKGLVK